MKSLEQRMVDVKEGSEDLLQNLMKVIKDSEEDSCNTPHECMEHTLSLVTACSLLIGQASAELWVLSNSDPETVKFKCLEVVEKSIEHHISIAVRLKMEEVNKQKEKENEENS